MSPLTPRGRVLAIVAAAVCLGVIVLLGVRGHSGSPARPRTASASPVPTPSATPAVLPDPASLEQAVAVARAFLVAYASAPPDDTPATLRARLRPYDTDSLDAALGQGAAAPPGTNAAAAAVRQITPVALAPDGRLVMTAQVGDRYVELYLARTPAGWRVAEVAL
ncbi:MAG TPA: hypothetical protein VLW53_00795 [Candidatus Eisenbacteria bacterium]|nr:hypothetical protein [Candidatus Eisenbacteria bacterium]